MDSLRSFLMTFLSDRCFDVYFVEFDFFDVPCFKTSLSKVLGLLIIAGSVMVKVPQIVKIQKNGSGKGINIIGVNMELLAITATISYSFVKGFPFSAWGDGVFLAIQTAIISALVILYGGNKSGAIVYIILYCSLIGALTCGLTPVSFLWTLQAGNIPVVFFGKMMQAHTNYKNGSTGQLSAVTCFMLLFGSVARIFTSIQETGDFIIILTYCVASSVNALIVGQLLWYWNVDESYKKKHKNVKRD